jgi:hypothetical protein
MDLRLVLLIKTPKTQIRQRATGKTYFRGLNIEAKTDGCHEEQPSVEKVIERHHEYRLFLSQRSAFKSGHGWCQEFTDTCQDLPSINSMKIVGVILIVTPKPFGNG